MAMATQVADSLRYGNMLKVMSPIGHDRRRPLTDSTHERSLFFVITAD